eukprot:g15281.t1
MQPEQNLQRQQRQYTDALTRRASQHFDPEYFGQHRRIEVLLGAEDPAGVPNPQQPEAAFLGWGEWRSSSPGGVLTGEVPPHRVLEYATPPTVVANEAPVPPALNVQSSDPDLHRVGKTLLGMLKGRQAVEGGGEPRFVDVEPQQPVVPQVHQLADVEHKLLGTAVPAVVSSVGPPPWRKAKVPMEVESPTSRAMRADSAAFHPGVERHRFFGEVGPADVAVGADLNFRQSNFTEV